MPTITSAVSPNPYEPLKLLYTVFAAELEIFLAAARGRGHRVSAFVENTFCEFRDPGDSLRRLLSRVFP